MALENLPNDPFMLLSFVNTRMRDDNISLDEFAKQFEIDKKIIEEKLDNCGYSYNNDLRKFV